VSRRWPVTAAGVPAPEGGKIRVAAQATDSTIARSQTRRLCRRPSGQRPTTGKVIAPVQQDTRTHRIVVVVEVDEPTDLSPADLVALADVLRDAAAELAPRCSTRASVELGVAAVEPPEPRTPPDDAPARTA